MGLELRTADAAAVTTIAGTGVAMVNGRETCRTSWSGAVATRPSVGPLSSDCSDIAQHAVARDSDAIAPPPQHACRSATEGDHPPQAAQAADAVDAMNNAASTSATNLCDMIGFRRLLWQISRA